MKPYPFTGRHEVTGTVLRLWVEHSSGTAPNGYSFETAREMVDIRVTVSEGERAGDYLAFFPRPRALLSCYPGDRLTIRAEWDGQGRGKRSFKVTPKPAKPAKPKKAKPC